jgi:hypothetical protein
MNRINESIPLKEKCPNCGANLYAHFHMMCSDMIESGLWYVECQSACGYEDNDPLPRIESILEKFNEDI